MSKAEKLDSLIQAILSGKNKDELRPLLKTIENEITFDDWKRLVETVEEAWPEVYAEYKELLDEIKKKGSFT